MRRGHAVRTLAALGIALGLTESTLADSGVVFMYHHVDDSTPTSTSVSPAEFAAQLDWLAGERFNVLPLMDLLDALASGSRLPERSVAITFDDAYGSVLTEALPRLQARGWPFTVFVSTEAIDAGYRGYLTWSQLRLLGERGATFGNHSVSHAHLVRESADESRSAWRRRVATEITRARSRLEDELGDGLIPAFAYPYGEYTTEVRALVGESERYGLGQHSGAIGPGSDFLALPRFPVATGLELDEFALRARSRPLPVRLLDAERHITEANEDRPSLTLAIEAGDDIRVADLACYASNQGLMALEWRNESKVEFTVTPEQALRPGRNKYNCTAPSRTQAGVYYWYSHLWMHRQPDGRWYPE